MYFCYLFLVSSASVRSIPFLSFIEPIFAWNVPFVSLIFFKRSLVFPILLFSSIHLHWLTRKAFLSLLAVLWNSALNTMEYYLVIKRNTFESVLMRWMNIKPIIWSEVSQKEKDKYQMLCCAVLSCLVMSDSLQPFGLLHTSLPCPIPSPEACSNSCPLSQWCHPTISFSVISFSSCLQSSPGSRSFLMS